MPGTSLPGKGVCRRKVMQGLWHSVVRLNWLGFAEAWNVTSANLQTRRNMANEREVSELEMCLCFWPLHTCDQHYCSLSASSILREPWFYYEVQQCCQYNHSTSQIPLWPGQATCSNSGQWDNEQSSLESGIEQLPRFGLLLFALHFRCECGRRDQPL